MAFAKIFKLAGEMNLCSDLVTRFIDLDIYNLVPRLASTLLNAAKLGLA